MIWAQALIKFIVRVCVACVAIRFLIIWHAVFYSEGDETASDAAVSIKVQSREQKNNKDATRFKELV